MAVQIAVVSIITAIFNTEYMHFVHAEYSCIPNDVYKKHYYFLVHSYKLFFVRTAHGTLSETTVKAVYTPE